MTENPLINPQKEDSFSNSEKPIDDVTVTPWYERFQELFANRSQTSVEEDENNSDSLTKRGRFKRLLGRIFQRIAPKDEIGDNTSTQIVDNPEVMFDDDQAADQITVTDELPVMPDLGSSSQDELWREGKIETVTHDISEVEAEPEAKHHLKPEGILNIFHDQFAEQPVKIEDHIAEEETKETQFKKPVIIQRPYYTRPLLNSYESRAYTEYRMAQKAREKAWEAVQKIKSDQKPKEATPANNQKDAIMHPKVTPERSFRHYPKTLEVAQHPHTPEIDRKDSSKEVMTNYIETPSKPRYYELSPLDKPESFTSKQDLKEVLERVVEAADHNEAIEKSYELRHEIKEEQQTTSHAPVAIGSIVAEAVNSLAGSNSSLPLASRDSLRKAYQQQQKQVSDLYVGAAKSGFYSALVLIVLGLLSYLVMR